MNCKNCDFCIQHYQPDMGSGYSYYECCITLNKIEGTFNKFLGHMAPDRKCDVETDWLMELINEIQEEVDGRDKT